MSDFASVTSVGGLLPSDLLSEVSAGSKDLDGTAPDAYGLVPGERLNDHITRSWNRLTTVWGIFNGQLDQLPDTEQTATTLTRERWLRPLLDELGFAGLNQAHSVAIDGKDYAISHQWGDSVPVHLLGAKIPIDRRSPGIPGAATSSPHGLVQEFLNRSDRHLWALLTNGQTLRLLRDNASLTRQAYVEFDLQAIFDGELYSDFALLWLTCHRTRFEGDPPEKCLLEQWSQHAATSGTRALDRLRNGVEAAIESLGEGFLAHPANVELRQRLTDGSLTTADYQRQLLRVVYRLLFLLVTEARDLLLAPGADEVTRARYRDHYSLGRIVRLARVRRGSTHDDLWDGLRITIRALWQDGELALGLAPLGSFLWSPDSTAALGSARLDNAHLLEAIRRLTLTRDAEAKVDRTVDYRNLGAEELGSIYESLLERQASLDVNGRQFELNVAGGNERKTTGSYYTQTSLIVALLDEALDPILDEAARAADPETATLDVTVLDPACGSGHFLIAAANRIAQRLAAIRAGGVEPAPDQVRGALRDVVARCVHGIDINPMAVELCKVSLWLEATEPGKPLSFLDHRILTGNGLVGATPAMLERPVPDGAYTAVEGDDKPSATAQRKRNREEAAGQQTLAFGRVDVDSLTAPIATAVAEIDAIADSSIEGIAKKQELYEDLRASTDRARAEAVADTWCAAFFCLKIPGSPQVTSDHVRQAAVDPTRVPGDVRATVADMRERYAFLHPHLAFPDVFHVTSKGGGSGWNEEAGWCGGFSLVLGNPPWDTMSPDAKEFFSQYDAQVRSLKKADQEALIEELLESPVVNEAWTRYRRDLFASVNFIKTSGRYRLFAPGNLGKGDFNVYRMFVETALLLAGPSGWAAQLTPSNIYNGANAQAIRAELFDRWELRVVLGFLNEGRRWFDIHAETKFCLYAARRGGPDDFLWFSLRSHPAFRARRGAGRTTRGAS